MCLATVQKSDDTVVCRNVSRIDVDGEKVIIRDIMGDEFGSFKGNDTNI